MIDRDDIAIFAKAAQQLQPSGARPRHARSRHAWFQDRSAKGDCPDDGRTRAERKVQRNDHPARSQGAKARLADARFRGLHRPTYRGFHLPILGIPEAQCVVTEAAQTSCW